MHMVWVSRFHRYDFLQVLNITWLPRWLATIFNWMDYINLGLCFEMHNPSVALMMCYVSRAVFREVVLHAMTEDLGWYLAQLSAKLSIACWHLSPGYLCSLDTSPSAIFLTNYKWKFSQIRKKQPLISTTIFLVLVTEKLLIEVC